MKGYSITGRGWALIAALLLLVVVLVGGAVKLITPLFRTPDPQNTDPAETHEPSPSPSYWPVPSFEPSPKDTPTDSPSPDPSPTKLVVTAPPTNPTTTTPPTTNDDDPSPNTPRPAITLTPKPTPSPTLKPTKKPTAKPEPTRTPTPKPTKKPTAQPEPPETATPQPTPDPTATPESTPQPPAWATKTVSVLFYWNSDVMSDPAIALSDLADMIPSPEEMAEYVIQVEGLLADDETADNLETLRAEAVAAMLVNDLSLDPVLIRTMPATQPKVTNRTLQRADVSFLLVENK